MCDTSGSETEPARNDSPSRAVISLCAHRRRRQIDRAIPELIDLLALIHGRAIEVHNNIIARAQLSVLTELCRTAGLNLDRIDDQLQASVIIPATIYGDSGDTVFGKKPLQKRLARTFDGKPATALLQQLYATHPAIWQVRARPNEPTDAITSLAGPDRDEERDVAGVIMRAGKLSSQPGVYCGWPIDFRGESYIVFGHRLQREREVAVRDLLAARADRDDPEIWKRIAFPLLRAIVDPGDRHQRPPLSTGCEAVRKPVSRNGLLLAVRRSLWRHFAEPGDGLTIHAHIASLVDDEQDRRAFLDEVREIIDGVTLKSGRHAGRDDPLTLAEVLSPFFVDDRGSLPHRGPLRHHPPLLLMLRDSVRHGVDLTPFETIDDVLKWATQHSDHTAARRIEIAWIVYRTEQNLMATYGWHHGRLTGDDPPQAGPCFARRSPVLPNMRILFDARFMQHCLADLDLDGPDRARLERALNAQGQTLSDIRLADLGRDERDLARLHGVSHQTCNAVRRALLEFGLQWRFHHCALRPKDIATDH